MQNSEFEIGSHIIVHGNRGIVESITKCKEYTCIYNSKKIDKALLCTKEEAETLRKDGYTLIATGRTATYFKIDFSLEKQLKNTAYNHTYYGCVDEYENYDTLE